MPTRDGLTTAWADDILPKLTRKVSIWWKGRFVSVDDGVAVFAVEDANFQTRAEKHKPEVEAALRDHFGVAIQLQLTIDGAAASAPAAQAQADTHDEPDFDAPVAESISPEDHVKAAFPGAEEVANE